MQLVALVAQIMANAVLASTASAALNVVETAALASKMVPLSREHALPLRSALSTWILLMIYALSFKWFRA